MNEPGEWAYTKAKDFAKVTYITRDGTTTQAYIDMEDGQGTEKHTDIRIQVEWSDDQNSWVQIDDWEWEYNPLTERFEFVKS